MKYSSEHLNLSPTQKIEALVKVTDVFSKIKIQLRGATSDNAFSRIEQLDMNYKPKQRAATEAELQEATDIISAIPPVVTIEEAYFPGPNDVMTHLKECYIFKTLPDPDSKGNNEPVFIYENGIYVRAEEVIKEAAHSAYMRLWHDMASWCGEILDGDPDNKGVYGIQQRCVKAMHRGPSVYEVSEVMQAIRRTTFTDPNSANPHSHVPFRNGLLNLESFKLEPFDSGQFYTYRVEADYLDRFVSLKEAPLFNQYIRGVFHPLDIPQVLQYLGYALVPGKPRDKVLFVVGREGIGKGVIARIMDGLLGDGAGAMDLNKLLTSDKFQFSGLEGHVLLVDPEIDRKFRRDAKVTTRNFNTLFGSDAAYNERKFREGKKQNYHAKGIFLGNLPLFRIDDMAAFRRILLVQTLTQRPSQDVPDLHLKILESERDVLATLLVQYLRVLKKRNWVFVNEPTKESIAEIWAQFADPVGNFEDECIEAQEGAELKVSDAYEEFEDWCKKKGIPTPPQKTFATRLFKSYPKAKKGPKGKQYLIFQCMIIDRDTTKNDGGGSNSTVSREERYGIHIMYNLLPKVLVSNNKKYHSIEYGHHRDTTKNDSRNPEIRAPEENKMVSLSDQMSENSPIRYLVVRPFNPEIDPLGRDLPCEEGTILEFTPADEFGKDLLKEGYIAPYKEVAQ